MKYGNTFKMALAAVACFSVLSLAQIPTIKITTQNNQVPPYAAGTACSGGNNNGGWGWGMDMGSTAPRLDYIRMTKLEVSGASNQSYNKTISGEPDSIRRRGNSTANTDKIPFRVKFDKRQNLFGNESKSWAFLANYYDATMMLNAIALELGRRIGLEFTPKYQFVKLELNGQSRGVYLMTPQISGNQYSVNVDRDLGGWLVEFDYHTVNNTDCMRQFTTSQYDIKTKIRYPEWGDDVTDSTDSRYRGLKNDINGLVNKMQASGYPTNGYRDLIDLDSWAKYVLIQLFMDNFDFNSKAQSGYLLGSNYLYRVDNRSKIKAGPLWDFDLAAGVTQNNFPAHYNNYTDMLKPTHTFYTKLWADNNNDGFLGSYKRAWDNYKKHFEDMSKSGGFIDSLSNLLASSAATQGNMVGSGSFGMTATQLTQQTFNSEVSKLKTWWNNRLNRFGQEVNSLNVPGYNSSPSSSSAASSSSVASSSSAVSSSSVASSSSRASSSSAASSSSRASSSSAASSSSRASSSSAASSSSSAGTSPIAIRQIATSNGVSAIKNGVNLQVQTTASLEVYNLNGSLEKTMNFSSGVYNIPLSDLPKGMYVIKAMFGSERKTLRISVM